MAKDHLLSRYYGKAYLNDYPIFTEENQLALKI